MYIWNAEKISVRGKAKILVNFYEPDLYKIIGISRLKRNVSLRRAFSSRGFLLVEIINQRGEVEMLEFTPEEVMQVVEKWYSKNK